MRREVCSGAVSLSEPRGCGDALRRSGLRRIRDMRRFAKIYFTNFRILATFGEKSRLYR